MSVVSRCGNDSSFHIIFMSFLLGYTLFLKIDSYGSKSSVAYMYEGIMANIQFNRCKLSTLLVHVPCFWTQNNHFEIIQPI